MMSRLKHLLLSLAVAGLVLSGQPAVKILEPRNGAVVHPGQSITVRVGASAGVDEVAVLCSHPLLADPFILNKPPYIFKLVISANLEPGVYGITANDDGPRMAANGDSIVKSDGINIDVEPRQSPIRLEVRPRSLRLRVGECQNVEIEGIFPDGSTTRLINSSLNKLVSDHPTIAAGSSTSIINALAPGSATFTVSNGAAQEHVEVFVEK